jgi:hypothetical protein
VKITINMFCDRLLGDNKMEVLMVAIHARKLDPSIRLETVQAIYDVKFTLDSCIMFSTGSEEDKQIIARLTSEYESLLSQGMIL